MPLAPGTDDSVMLVILLSCVCWVSVYSNSLTRRQRREMGILPSCHSLEEFFRETIKHNAIIVSAESPDLPRMTLAPVHDANRKQTDLSCIIKVLSCSLAMEDINRHTLLHRHKQTQPVLPCWVPSSPPMSTSEESPHPKSYRVKILWCCVSSMWTLWVWFSKWYH